MPNLGFRSLRTGYVERKLLTPFVRSKGRTTCLSMALLEIAPKNISTNFANTLKY